MFAIKSQDFFDHKKFKTYFSIIFGLFQSPNYISKLMQYLFLAFISQNPYD